MEFGLNEEQEMVVETVRSFVENEIYPLENQIEKSGVVHDEIGQDIKNKVIKLGFFAPNMPVDVGGGGLDNLTFALLARELGRGSQGLPIFWGRPSNISTRASRLPSRSEQSNSNPTSGFLMETSEMQSR